MERSSPLAAMQPPPFPFGAFGCRSDLQSSYSSFGGRLGCGTTSFNFQDMSMAKPQTDYFNLKPVRGSSPTASLAADLSQNFHIDHSPQLPTPRRALFSSNLFPSLRTRNLTTTPPPPSSSPGPCNESMEISPLPHKAPFVVTTDVETPSECFDEDTVDTSMDVTPDLQFELPKPCALQERRRPTLLRPSLSRTKGFSTSAVTFKRVECPPFKFGNGVVSPTPKECTGGSPMSPNRPQSADSPSSQPMGPPRFKQSFPSINSHVRAPGPPMFGPIRKQASPMQRPRKQFRRSLSMFEHPGDVMKEEKSGMVSLDSIMDIEDSHQLQLPHFNNEEELIPRITKETMADVLDGKYGQLYSRSMVVDCRFEYEYEGGHIEGAINYNDKEELAKKLFQEPCTGNTLLIFHCEYSAMRAPNMAKYIRERDRACNAHRYPSLTFPEIYILDGGYSAFFTDHRLRCSPQNYVAMSAKEHAKACERGLGRIKNGGRAKLCRAQTFAFGQRDGALDDSPTAPSKQGSVLALGMEIVMSQRDESKRLASRRMVSF